MGKTTNLNWCRISAINSSIPVHSLGEFLGKAAMIPAFIVHREIVSSLRDDLGAHWACETSLFHTGVGLLAFIRNHFHDPPSCFTHDVFLFLFLKTSLQLVVFVLGLRIFIHIDFFGKFEVGSTNAVSLKLFSVPLMCLQLHCRCRRWRWGCVWPRKLQLVVNEIPWI